MYSRFIWELWVCWFLCNLVFNAVTKFSKRSNWILIIYVVYASEFKMHCVRQCFSTSLLTMCTENYCVPWWRNSLWWFVQLICSSPPRPPSQHYTTLEKTTLAALTTVPKGLLFFSSYHMTLIKVASMQKPGKTSKVKVLSSQIVALRTYR